MKFYLLAVLLLAAVATEAKNTQNGRFFLYKVRAQNTHEAEALLRQNAEYGSHPPIFLQPVRVGDATHVLMEESKTEVFEKIMDANKIYHQEKGLSLVESITANDPPAPGTKKPTCDCDYHKGGCMISKPPPAGHACKCVYKGFWTCTGYAFSCDPNMHCPANCSSLQCCHTGRGDCGGYSL